MNGSPPLSRSTRLPSLREPDQQLADLFLRQRVVGAPLADIDALGLAPHEVHDARIDQTVVEHDVGLLHQPERAEGQQVGVARAGADEIDLAERRPFAAFRRAIERFGERRLGRRLVAGEHQLGDRPFERAFPEASPRGRRAEPGVDQRARAADERGEPAVGGGDQRLQARAQHPPEQRRSAAGRDRHDERRAIEDRGRDEVAEVGAVGDADRRSGAGEGGVEPFVSGGIAGRDIADEAAGEVGPRRLARDMGEGEAFAERRELLFVEPRRVDRDKRAGARQRFDAARRHQTAADDRRSLAGGAQEQRQVGRRRGGRGIGTFFAHPRLLDPRIGSGRRGEASAIARAPQRLGPRLGSGGIALDAERRQRDRHRADDSGGGVFVLRVATPQRGETVEIEVVVGASARVVDQRRPAHFARHAVCDGERLARLVGPPLRFAAFAAEHRHARFAEPQRGVAVDRHVAGMEHRLDRSGRAERVDEPRQRMDRRAQAEDRAQGEQFGEPRAEGVQRQIDEVARFEIRAAASSKPRAIGRPRRAIASRA